MSAVPYIVFALVAAIAVLFAAIPLFRIEKAKTRYLSLAAAALFIIGVGTGTYYLLGRPHLAQDAAAFVLYTERMCCIIDNF